MSFYDFTLARSDGSELATADLKGKVVLVVNTATGCGFTPQYEDLVEIYNRHHEAGLEILDIPCNQFRDQAPGTDEEIAQFCRLNYGTPWEQMRKADVTGATAIDLFRFLTQAKGFEGFGRGAKALALSAAMKAMDRNYRESDDVKWNFTKFLVSREGEVVARFEPTAPMKDVEAAIAALL